MSTSKIKDIEVVSELYIQYKDKNIYQQANDLNNKNVKQDSIRKEEVKKENTQKRYNDI